MTVAAARPRADRIATLDVARGVALLGILVMNVTSFAMPEAAYDNPLAYGGDSPADRLVFGLEYVFANQKFMGLFSLLFGAGIILLTQRLEATGRPTARIYFARHFWLFLFGLAHLTLIWAGDILTLYAVCGILLYPLRHLRARWLLGLGAVILLVPSLLAVPTYAGLSDLDPTVMEEVWQPSPAAIDEEIAIYQGGWEDGAADRLEEIEADEAYDWLLLWQLIDYAARGLGMMLLGMAAGRTGLLAGRVSGVLLRRLAAWGLGIGLPLAVLGLAVNVAAGWPALFSQTIGRVPNNLATPLVTVGYAALIALWCRTTIAAGLQGRLAAVGQLALTNYIAESLLGTFIFYGWGLGLFGEVSRTGQLLVVAAIWGVVLIVSPWWLSRFRYGPLEWLWRTLTYWRWQPMRRS